MIQKLPNVSNHELGIHRTLLKCSFSKWFVIFHQNRTVFLKLFTFMALTTFGEIAWPTTLAA